MLLINFRLALVAFITIPLFVTAALLFRASIRAGFRQVRKANGEINVALSETISGVREIHQFGYEEQSRKSFAKQQHQLPRRLPEGRQRVRPVLPGDRDRHQREHDPHAPVRAFLGGSAAADRCDLRLLRLHQHVVLPASAARGEVQSPPVRRAAPERIFALADEKVTIVSRRGNLGRAIALPRGAGLRERPFPLRAGCARPPRHLLPRRPGREGGDRGAHRERQDDADQPRDPAVRRAGGPDPAGRHRRPRHPTGNAPHAQSPRCPRMSSSSRARWRKTSPSTARRRTGGRGARRSGSARQPLRREAAHGYAEEVGEEGKRLSEGQRQLLGLSRAFARDPCLVILDEATSNIDSETEHLIGEGIQRLLANRTALIIAHRLSTIRTVDRILVLLGGGSSRKDATRSLSGRTGCTASSTRCSHSCWQSNSSSFNCPTLKPLQGLPLPARFDAEAVVHSKWLVWPSHSGIRHFQVWFPVRAVLGQFPFACDSVLGVIERPRKTLGETR